jgi:hypothetical protein
MTSELFESLLWMSESDSLDFKREQYPFEGGTDEQKGELLKDILAFSNSWRSTDAYILIGVQENRGGRANVLGVDKHLLSNTIQQFIDGKTNKPLRFSYIPFDYEGKQVGIIIIPAQIRPFYLRRKFGKLEADVVYIRRGDATVISKPDEISQMGHSQLQREISRVPDLVSAVSFEFSHRPGNKNCQLAINIVISNNSPLVPSLNTKAKLWIGNHALDLINEGQTIHYGEPFSTYESYQFRVPDMYSPIEKSYRLSFGSDQCPLKVSDFRVRITTATLLGPFDNVIRYAEDHCKFEREIVRENVFLHETPTTEMA